MKNIGFLALILVSVLVFSSVALGADFSDLDFDQIKNSYNSDIDDVPWILKMVAGSEKILIEIENADGTNSYLKLETKDGMIISFGEGEISDPSIVIKMDEAKVNEIMKSGDILGGLAESIQNKELEIEPIGLGMSVKMFFMNILIWLGELVGITGNYLIPLV